MILAKAARTASALVRCFFTGAGALVSPFSPFASPLAQGIVGSIGAGADGPCSAGCIRIGPVLLDGGVFLGMTVNAQPPFSFEGRDFGQQ
jgi:hypothetical protein